VTHKIIEIDLDELTIPTCKWVMNELQKDEIAELEQDND